MNFNKSFPRIMHIDINSCFATIEQQANPLLREKPVLVAAYDSPGGCVIAPSIEAKSLGVSVGMRVKEAKLLVPDAVVLTPDPWKYRFAHLCLSKIVEKYTDRFFAKSIDEFVLDFSDSPFLRGNTIKNLAKEIKKEIKTKVGEWITVSVGISTNRFLAKVASELHKPDGLDEINKDNFKKIYSQIALKKLWGIKERNSIRLNSEGIYSVLDFYNAPLWKLKAAFKSICGFYWYLRLRGWEIDDFNSLRKSFGNSYALAKPFFEEKKILPIISKLVEKTSVRLRKAGYFAKGVGIWILYRDYSFSHKSKGCSKLLFDSRDIFKEICFLLRQVFVEKPIREISISVFDLVKTDFIQLDFFKDQKKRFESARSIDKINGRWGEFSVIPGRMLESQNYAIDRIGFGSLESISPISIKEMEEFILN